jgi:hypothetical protein
VTSSFDVLFPMPENRRNAEEQWYPGFADWLEREMPEGTVIGDPLWWASKIADYLARYGTAQPAPVPVGERLPQSDDLAPWPDGKPGEPWCWFGKLIHDDEDVHFQWVQCWPKYGTEYGYTHWLPHWALPLPGDQP